ncbi:copper-binding protein [Delftia tsuruhatensis]|uniref:copper-binding protein n=1 Tax=Delftia tsuruhatensis TaxID=180282 RepID=UPI0020901840|nr:copper-binding protein [Delftia tsuruhatensis]MCO5337024.1 copper-binding protein [Delftia tsuruhatensis]
MNNFKQLLSISAIALGMAFPMSGFAQVNPASTKAEASLQDSLTDGEIKKIDLDNGKVTIKHGDIKNLDMPGMTMVFPVKEKSLLNNLKPGDKVKFMVINEGGKMLVTDIKPAQ